MTPLIVCVQLRDRNERLRVIIDQQKIIPERIVYRDKNVFVAAAIPNKKLVDADSQTEDVFSGSHELSKDSTDPIRLVLDDSFSHKLFSDPLAALIHSLPHAILQNVGFGNIQQWYNFSLLIQTSCPEHFQQIFITFKGNIDKNSLILRMSQVEVWRACWIRSVMTFPRKFYPSGLIYG